MSRQRNFGRSVAPVLTVLEDRSVPAAFNPGSIQAQDGWSGGSVDVRPEVTQGVNQGGTLSQLGSGAFVVSNSTASGNFNGGFAGWPVSPALAVAAGQPSSGAAADIFGASVWFRTVSTTADGSNIEIDLGTADGTDRNSILSITNYSDADGGLQMYYAEPDGATGNLFEYEFFPVTLVRGVWHKLDIVATFRDGSANDTYTIALNGTQLVNPATNGTTFGTLEGYFEGQPTHPPYAQTNRLMFRSGFTASELDPGFSDAGAAGFAFDNIVYYSANTAAPVKPLAAYYAAFENRPTVTYSNPSFTSPGVITDANPNLAGDQTVTVGTDAFDTLAAAAAAVAPGGEVWAFGPTSTGPASPLAGTTLNLGGANGIAAVTNSGDVAFSTGSIYFVDLFGPAAGTQHDKLTVVGTANIGGAQLVLNTAFTPAATDSFTILEATSVVGQFAGLPEGAVVGIGGLQYKVRYTGTAVVLELDRADVSVTITNNQTSVLGGSATSYTVVVTNTGPRAVTGSLFTFNPPAELLNSTFGSVAAGGATGNTAGAGPISNLLNLPVGASVVYTITGTVSATATGNLSLTANAQWPTAEVVELNPANNTAADSDVIIPPDTTRPTAVITPAAAFTIDTPVTVTITFSEPVVGFGPSRFTLSNATLSSFSGSGAVYTVVVVPTAGTVQLSVLDGAATDAAGNPSVPVVATFSAALAQVPPPPTSPRYATSVGGMVSVRNPVDGSIRTFPAFPGFSGPVTVATGDLNGDGVFETVIGAGPGGGPHVRVFNGANGMELASFFAYDISFRGGVSVAVGGGRIITGAGAGGGPHVKAFDGRTLAEVHSFFAYDTSFTGGVNVAAGDVNSDGVVDIVTGAGAGAGPHVKAFSGDSLAVLHSFFAFDPSFTGGVNVAAGLGRIIVGAETGLSAEAQSAFNLSVFKGGGVGYYDQVKVFNGSTGAEEQRFTAYDGFAGGVRVALNDVNNDGVPDLITGAGPGGGAHVKVFTLPSLIVIDSFFANDVSASSPGVFVS
jgi:hypothetical protein